MKRKTTPFLAVILGSALAWGCATFSPAFDQKALDQAVGLKSQALAVMSRGAQPFNTQATDVAALRTRLDEAVAYAESRPKNDKAAKQWKVLADPNANLLGGFLSRWEGAGQLSSAFITEASSLVGAGFDKIIELENARRP